jgi:hypothetical protein
MARRPGSDGIVHSERFLAATLRLSDDLRNDLAAACIFVYLCFTVWEKPEFYKVGITLDVTGLPPTQCHRHRCVWEPLLRGRYIGERYRGECRRFHTTIPSAVNLLAAIAVDGAEHLSLVDKGIAGSEAIYGKG